MAQSGIESLCNRVAGEVLVPEVELRAKWQSIPDIQTLARFFRVSRIVVARRAYDLKLIDKALYDSIAAQAEKQKNKRAGGDPWATIPARNSRLLTKVLVGEAMSGQMLLREAASLLNIKPDTVVALSREL